MMNDAEMLVARLIAHRWVERTDVVARRIIMDEGFRAEIERRLGECGLRLVEHPYADHIGAALKGEIVSGVLADGQGGYLSNNLQLPRDGVALLVILWALLILPKRARQLERADEAEGEVQSNIFPETQTIPPSKDVSRGISEASIYADYGKKLGAKFRFTTLMSQLAKNGFIVRRNNIVREGPMLDLMMDYGKVAPRILTGALEDLFGNKEASPNVQI